MSQKILFFDIDGTLTDEKTGEIPASAHRAVEAVRRAGHLVFINTGRVECMVKPVLEKISVDGVLCGCGTQVILDNQTIWQQRIPRERGIEIKKNMERYRIEAILEAQQGIYFPARPFRHGQVLENAFEAFQTMWPTFDNAYAREDFDFDKFVIWTDPKNPMEDKQGFFQTISDFTIIDRGQGMYECVPENVSKGSAIDMMLERYQIAPENAYVFGDSGNDLSMFTSVAKNRILMGEHDPILEPHATFVTKNASDDGIDYAIKMLEIV
ncbi:MAG: HAD family phosphatase [Lachnospiraceae bacterium]|jgi:HAD hydrolase, family IIB|nr:HAD family phosphatase [Lachnospiraceae bacterium]